jgi:hypothetical protein
MVSVVVLSNISEAQAPARSRNLLSLGSDRPLVANEGLKGLAVKKLAACVRASGFLSTTCRNISRPQQKWCSKFLEFI